jgi:hypothetical protein
MEFRDVLAKYMGCMESKMSPITWHCNASHGFCSLLYCSVILNIVKMVVWTELDAWLMN